MRTVPLPELGILRISYPVGSDTLISLLMLAGMRVVGCSASASDGCWTLVPLRILRRSLRLLRTMSKRSRRMLCATFIVWAAFSVLPGVNVSPYIIPSNFLLLSMGRRCQDDGLDFIWLGSRKMPSYFIRKDGSTVVMGVEDNIP